VACQLRLVFYIPDNEENLLQKIQTVRLLNVWNRGKPKKKRERMKKNEFSLPFRELEKDNTETLHRKPKIETNW